MLLRLFQEKNNNNERNIYKLFLCDKNNINAKRERVHTQKKSPNYSSILFMDINVKILNKILVNGIQQYIKE